jgi:hypothetical protein
MKVPVAFVGVVLTLLQLLAKSDGWMSALVVPKQNVQKPLAFKDMPVPVESNENDGRVQHMATFVTLRLLKLKYNQLRMRQAELKSAPRITKTTTISSAESAEPVLKPINAQETLEPLEGPPRSMHSKEGDRIIAMQDDFTDHTVSSSSTDTCYPSCYTEKSLAVLPIGTSKQFGRHLEVIRANLPVLRVWPKVSTTAESVNNKQSPQKTDKRAVQDIRSEKEGAMKKQIDALLQIETMEADKLHSIELLNVIDSEMKKIMNASVDVPMDELIPLKPVILSKQVEKKIVNASAEVPLNKLKSLPPQNLNNSIKMPNETTLSASVDSLKNESSSSQPINLSARMEEKNNASVYVSSDELSFVHPLLLIDQKAKEIANASMDVTTDDRNPVRPQNLKVPTAKETVNATVAISRNKSFPSKSKSLHDSVTRKEVDKAANASLVDLMDQSNSSQPQPQISRETKKKAEVAFSSTAKSRLDESKSSSPIISSAFKEGTTINASVELPLNNVISSRSQNSSETTKEAEKTVIATESVVSTENVIKTSIDVDERSTSVFVAGPFGTIAAPSLPVKNAHLSEQVRKLSLDDDDRFRTAFEVIPAGGFDSEASIDSPNATSAKYIAPSALVGATPTVKEGSSMFIAGPSQLRSSTSNGTTLSSNSTTSTFVAGPRPNGTVSANSKEPLISGGNKSISSNNKSFAPWSPKKS